MARIEPWNGSTMNIELDFETAVIGRRSIFVDLFEGRFRDDLSRARTFGFLHEIEALRAAGLARGGSLENAVVISGDRVLNEDGLRFADECVRHKALDCIGDLFLAGAPIIGHFHGERPGHAINNRLLRALFADESAWEWIDLDDVAGTAKEPATLTWAFLHRLTIQVFDDRLRDLQAPPRPTQITGVETAWSRRLFSPVSLRERARVVQVGHSNDHNPV